MCCWLVAALMLLSGLVYAEPPGTLRESAAAPAVLPTKPKVVPAILIQRERLAGHDPHLPNDVKALYAGRIVTGSYNVCIGQNGLIDSVLPVRGIDHADELIMQTVRQWRYRPQPIPICFIQFFEFHVAAPDSTASEELAAGKALADAAIALTRGEPQRALDVARQVGLRGSSVVDEARRISGLAACLTKNAPEATASYRDAKTRAYAAMLVEVCQRNGLILQARSFVPQSAVK